MSFEATIEMLRARRVEWLGTLGVVAALFADDLDEAIRRLEHCRDATRNHERSLPRNNRRERRFFRTVADTADELIPPLRRLTEHQ